MSGLAGVFTASEGGRFVDAMLPSIVAQDAPHVIAHRGARFSLCGRGGERTIGEASANGCQVVVLGHPRLNVLARMTPSEVAAQLLRDYETRGPAALDRLEGDFALALVDEARSRVLLAVDRLGIRSLVYTADAERIDFGSTLDVVRSTGVNPAIDPQSIYDYVYFHVVPGPRTAYRGVQRIPAGHYLEWIDGRMTLRPYWHVNYAETSAAAPDAALVSEFKAVLHRGVARAAENARCGAFLSGGTDSSTVTGMLREVTGCRPLTFSIGFAQAGYDEMSYARVTAQHFDAQHHEYYVAPRDVVDAVPRIAMTYDQPFGNASAIPTYYCAKIAREAGVERILGGDGGDELFGGNARYATQNVYGLYARIPGFIRGALIEPVLLGPDLTARLPGIGKARRYVEQARKPMPSRYEPYNLLTRMGPAAVFDRDFLAVVDEDAPHRLLVGVHAQSGAQSLINQMLAIDLKLTLADNDLPKVTRTCELAGIDVAFPLLDDGVVDFAHRLPPRMKLRGSKLRYFFKAALADFLPPAVLAKKKHGFGLPVGPWLRDYPPLATLAWDAVGDLRKTGILNPQFPDTLRRSFETHPGYYGTMVWVLMMLSLWLRGRSL